MENHSTRKRFYISTENYPVVLLFKKGDNQNPIKYKGDIEEKSLIAWLEEETSIVVGMYASIRLLFFDNPNIVA